MRCEHLNGSICLIASRIAGRPAITNESACRHCMEHGKNEGPSDVTVSVALSSLMGTRGYRAAFDEWSHLLKRRQADPSKSAIDRLRAIEGGSGVGSHLWRLLAESGIRHDPRCDCLAWAERLNGWGVAGCRMARDEIAIHLKQEAKKLGWKKLIWKSVEAAARNPEILRWIDLADVYGSIVDEAVRMAEQDELKKAADEFAGRDED